MALCAMLDGFSAERKGYAMSKCKNEDDCRTPMWCRNKDKCQDAQSELASSDGYALRENRRKRRNIIIWQLARLRRLKATKDPTGQQLARIDQLEQATGSGFYGLSLYA